MKTINIEKYRPNTEPCGIPDIILSFSVQIPLQFMYNSRFECFFKKVQNFPQSLILPISPLTHHYETFQKNWKLFSSGSVRLNSVIAAIASTQTFSS